jgi:hypothetical protein
LMQNVLAFYLKCTCVWEEYIVNLLIFIKKAVEVPVIPKKVCRLVPVIVKNNVI